MEVSINLTEPPSVETPDTPTKDMSALQEEFAKYLLISREKASAVAEHGKSGFFAKMAEIKKSLKDKLDTLQAVKHLRPQELEALKIFMQKVKNEKEQPPRPKMKRPDGLELNLLGVALFSGDEFVSRTIRTVTKSSYSHVALLLHDITKAPDDPVGWYVYSANGSASQIMADHTMPQVQLEPWIHTVAGYAGAVVTRLMVFNPDSAPSSAVVTELIDKYIGLPYERQVLVLVKAINRTNVEGPGSADSAFCSEICYRFLTAANVLENTEVPENVWPTDFSDESDRLKLISAVWDVHVAAKGTPPPRPV